MITISDSNFVSYERYAHELLYLHWYAVRVNRNFPAGDNNDLDFYYDRESDMVDWLKTNCTGKFSTKNLLYVCFENRSDAFLFKLVYG